MGGSTRRSSAVRCGGLVGTRPEAGRGCAGFLGLPFCGYRRKERLPSADPRLVVVGRAADLVVGLEQGLAEEGANVPAAQPIDHALPMPLAHDETGKSQL